MSPSEIAWRLQGTLRDGLDRWRLPRLRHADVADPARRKAVPSEPAFAVTDALVGAHGRVDDRAVSADWQAALLQYAEQIASGRLTFFNLEARDVGSPVDWNRDHGNGRTAPLRFAAGIDYRDFETTGDAKFVWEPNRHHQLVVLGRAYRVSGEERFANAARELWTSWLEQCPFGLGMNWRSPLELAVRLINWVWAFDLLRPAIRHDRALCDRLRNSVYLHLWEITRKYSRGSSANNHRVGEAAGVFVAASYFRNLRKAEQWAAEARDILCDEIIAQTHSDGGTREQALGYHLFVLQFFTLAALVGRRAGTEFPQTYWDRLERMFEFAAGMAAGGEPPLFGDCDDGYVLDLGRTRGDLRAWLPVGAALFGRADFKAVVGEHSECAWWLLGEQGRERFDALTCGSSEGELASRAFPQTGYYLLQHGQAGDPRGISVLFDCAELGFGPLAAHGHADALSFTLRAFGTDILVDPGTYDYFTYAPWREYFRSTRAHNTIEVDGQDQSLMTGPFMWGARARATCRRWQPSAEGGVVSGEHDGYARLPDPVTHKRTLELHGPQRELTIRDEIVAREQHDIAVYFHFSEHCSVTRVDAQRVAAETGSGRVTIELDPRLTWSLLHGSEQPIAGWVSRGYHRRTPATTLVGRCNADGALSLVHRVSVEAPVTGPEGFF